MEKNDNQPKWDEKRLVQEHLKKADLIDHYDGKSFDDMAWSNQIRVKRIASALRAFLGVEDVEEKPINKPNMTSEDIEQKIEEIKTAIEKRITQYLMTHQMLIPTAMVATKQ